MKHFLLLALAFVVFACSEKRAEQCPTYYLETTEEVTDLYSHVKSIEFYPLNDSLPFGMVTKALFTANKDLLILDDGGQILLFSNNYTKVCHPILRGRASNEYISASDIALCGDNLIILDGSTVRYQSLSDRNKNWNYQLSVKAPCDAIAPMGDSCIYVFSAYSLNFNDNKKKKDNLLYAVNSEGSVISEYVRREDCTFTLFNISQTNGAHYYLRPQNNGNVFYSLEENGIEPKIKVDFGNSNIPERYYYNTADEDIGVYMTSPYYKLPLDLCETDKLYYMRCAGPDAADIALLFNIDTKQGIRWVNLPNDGDMRILTSDGNSFALIYTPAEDTEATQHGSLFNIIKSYSDSSSLQNGRSYLTKITIDV